MNLDEACEHRDGLDCPCLPMGELMPPCDCWACRQRGASRPVYCLTHHPGGEVARARRGTDHP